MSWQFRAGAVCAFHQNNCFENVGKKQDGSIIVKYICKIK